MAHPIFGVMARDIRMCRHSRYWMNRFGVCLAVLSHFPVLVWTIPYARRLLMWGVGDCRIRQGDLDINQHSPDGCTLVRHHGPGNVFVSL